MALSYPQALALEMHPTSSRRTRGLRSCRAGRKAPWPGQQVARLRLAAQVALDEPLCCKLCRGRAAVVALRAEGSKPLFTPLRAWRRSSSM